MRVRVLNLYACEMEEKITEEIEKIELEGKEVIDIVINNCIEQPWEKIKSYLVVTIKYK